MLKCQRDSKIYVTLCTYTIRMDCLIYPNTPILLYRIFCGTCTCTPVAYMSSSDEHKSFAMDSADFDHRDDEDAQSFHTATSSSSGYNEEDTAAGLSYRAGAGAGANDEAGNNEETSVSGMATAAGEGHSSNNSETTAQTAKEGHQQDDDYESSSCEEDQNDVFRDAGEAKEQKQKGNECFKNKEYENAITLYTNAIALCPRTEEEKPSRAIFHCNRAACYAGIVSVKSYFFATKYRWMTANMYDVHRKSMKHLLKTVTKPLN